MVCTVFNLVLRIDNANQFWLSVSSIYVYVNLLFCLWRCLNFFIVKLLWLYLIFCWEGNTFINFLSINVFFIHLVCLSCSLTHYVKWE